MSSRLGAGLWESKFIMPEHREAIKQRGREEGRRQRKTLDPQEMELIERALAESYREHRTITVRLFGEYEYRELTGIVTAVQTYRKEIKLSTAPDDWEWVRIKDIVAVE